MAGIPLMTDSDGMSGIEPLASGSSVEVSPAPGSISARSSANTAELLASTLFSVEPVSDTDDPSQPGTKTSKSNQNGKWQDEDGQTVSSIYSPLSTEIPGGNFGSNVKTGVGQGGKVNTNITGGDQNERYVPTLGSGRKSPSKALHVTVLTPPTHRSERHEATLSRSLTFQSDRVGSDELDGMNQTVLERRRDFVSKFDHDRDTHQRQRQNFGKIQDSLQFDKLKIQESLAREDISDRLKDYEEQRLSTDSTLTENLLRGITPAEDMSPYSLPYDSGLASNLQSLRAATQQSTFSDLEATSHSLGMRSESYLIQENLEKERYRRKHCELQIKDLQSKLLESQQLLAVAEATRRKKDSMIAQVEKNFSKIMSDWKVKDKEKLESLERLKRDCDKHQHIAKMREQELEVREKETKELRISQERLQDELIQLKEDSLSELEEMKNKRDVTLREMEHAVEERVAAEQHVKKVQDMLAKERSDWRDKETNFTNRLATLEGEISRKHGEFQRTLERETESAKRLLSENKERREKVSQLQNQLSKTLQEKESLSLEMSLKQAQFEASLQKQEMDWKEQMERLIQERMESLQEETSRQLEDQRSDHHAQIADMTERHQDEIGRLREEYADEMKKREGRYQSSLEQFQTKLDESHQKIQQLSTKLDEVQKHRSFIIHKLQSCLQSYATDSLMMLGQLGSSPAASINQGHTQDNKAFTPQSNSQAPVPSERMQNERRSGDQHFIELMTSLSSDRGYQSLAATTDAGQASYSHAGNWSNLQPTASEVHDLPPPVRYDTTTPSLPKEGVVTERGLSANQQTFGGMTNMDGTKGHGQSSWRQMTSSGGPPVNTMDHSAGQHWMHSGRRTGDPSGRNSGPNGGHYITTRGGQIGQEGLHVSDNLGQGLNRGQYVTPTSGSTIPKGVHHGAPSEGQTGPFGAGAPYNQYSEQYANSGAVPNTDYATHRTTTQNENFVEDQMRSLAEQRPQYYHYEEAEIDSGVDKLHRSDYRSDSQLRGDTSERSGYQSGFQHQNNNSKRSQHQTEFRDSHLQGDRSKRSDLSYSSNHYSRLDHYEDEHFQPCPESDSLSLSEHPLNTTGQSLGDISQRLGKEDDRRQLLQHYLKELLDPASFLARSDLQTQQNRPQSKDISRTGPSLENSAQGRGTQNASGEQTSQRSNPAISESQRPSKNSPIERDIVPIKERTIPQKDGSFRSGRSSNESAVSAGRRSAEDLTSGQRLSDESKSGRRSANSSVRQGRSQPSKEQSAFGTSTPKKKGPRSVKPPTRKVKPKPGVWK